MACVPASQSRSKRGERRKRGIGTIWTGTLSAAAASASAGQVRLPAGTIQVLEEEQAPLGTTQGRGVVKGEDRGDHQVASSTACI